MGTYRYLPVTETGYPQRPGMNDGKDGAFVVVGARESRVHGEGRQEVRALHKPEERSVDSGHQADTAWLLSVQTMLYMRIPEYAMTSGEPDA